MIKKITLIFETPPEFLICCRGSSTVEDMLKSKNMHVEKNATTSKFGQFLPKKNIKF
jgi:hypothetical protein